LVASFIGAFATGEPVAGKVHGIGILVASFIGAFATGEPVAGKVHGTGILVGDNFGACGSCVAGENAVVDVDAGFVGAGAGAGAAIVIHISALMVGWFGFIIMIFLVVLYSICAYMLVKSSISTYIIYNKAIKQ
jgi:hypothetical protein